jgi:hemolysin III
MFPLYSLPIFLAVFILALGLPLKLILPAQPIMTALICAVTLYVVAYELWHAVLHLPFERFWQPMMAGRWTARSAKRMYSFHLMHHWRPSSNLAIVGFWGVAVWDYAFRTHRRPRRLPLNGAEVTYDDARLKKPLFPIALLDRWQSGLNRASRAIERYVAKVCLRRTSAGSA